MAKDFTIRVSIAASPAQVWAHLTDFENANTWMPGIDGLESITEGPVGVGSVITFNSRINLEGTEIRVFEPEKELVLVVIMGGIDIVYAYRLSPQGDETAITLTICAETFGFWRIIKPLVFHGVKKTDSKQLRKLKAVIEQEN